MRALKSNRELFCWEMLEVGMVRIVQTEGTRR